MHHRLGLNCVYICASGSSVTPAQKATWKNTKMTQSSPPQRWIPIRRPSGIFQNFSIFFPASSVIFRYYFLKIAGFPHTQLSDSPLFSFGFTIGSYWSLLCSSTLDRRRFYSLNAVRLCRFSRIQISVIFLRRSVARAQCWCYPPLTRKWRLKWLSSFKSVRAAPSSRVHAGNMDLESDFEGGRQRFYWKEHFFFHHRQSDAKQSFILWNCTFKDVHVFRGEECRVPPPIEGKHPNRDR